MEVSGHSLCVVLRLVFLPLLKPPVRCFRTPATRAFPHHVDIFPLLAERATRRELRDVVPEGSALEFSIFSNFDRTTTNIMERLPTELMVQVVGYSTKSTIHSFTIISSKYREIAQPLLFRRITISSMAGKRLALFVEQMENCSQLALMIKILIIRTQFTTELLRRMFAVVSALEELFIHCKGANFLLSPHHFPNLRRLHFLASRPEVFDDVVANFIPHRRILDDLSVSLPSKDFTSNSATLCMPPLAESVSSGVDRLVTYHGPRGLLPLLTPNSKMKHLTSSQQLDERTLRKLSSAVSGRLLSLVINDPMDPYKSKTLPSLIIPSLFPTLQSVAWLSVDIQSTSVIDQWPHLRRVWFTSRHVRLSGGVEAFVSKIQELSDRKSRSLQEIRVYAPEARSFPLTYSRASINSPWVLETRLPIVPSVG